MLLHRKQSKSIKTVGAPFSKNTQKKKLKNRKESMTMMVSIFLRRVEKGVIMIHLVTFLTKMDLMLWEGNMIKRAITSDPYKRTSRVIIMMILRITTLMTMKMIKSKEQIS